MKVINFGSINIDHVYRVDHFVRPGETLQSEDYKIFSGGKGANQSIALAYAGVKVIHAGKIGRDGGWLKEKLEKSGVELVACGTCIDYFDLKDKIKFGRVSDMGEMVKSMMDYDKVITV